MAAPTTLVSGTQILRTVRDDLARYRTSIQPHQRQMTIIRLTGASDPPQWRWRMQACRSSAKQKVTAFNHRGFVANTSRWPRRTSWRESRQVICPHV